MFASYLGLFSKIRAVVELPVVGFFLKERNLGLKFGAVTDGLSPKDLRFTSPAKNNNNNLYNKLISSSNSTTTPVFKRLNKGLIFIYFNLYKVKSVFCTNQESQFWKEP